MTTYTHDGITVTRSEDGRLYFTEGIRSTFLAADEAAAIHAAYLHSLGLALWEHDGAQWLIPTEGRGPDDGRRIIRLSDYSMLWANPESTDDAFDRALASYLAAQTPPEPPKPGERWLLGTDLGSVEQPVEVVEIGGERYFVLPCGTTPTLVHVADRDPSTYRRAES